MKRITVQLLKPAKNQVIDFPAMLLRHQDGEIVVQAEWTRPRLDLGYVVFETGDLFTEYYYLDHWYTIYAIGSPQHIAKGWYCNVARPAHFDGAILTSEDLEIDLFVSPDRQMLLTLDMDEFTARNFERDDLPTYQAALAALAELERLARTGIGPFAES